jgi:hypothetical protein
MAPTLHVLAFSSEGLFAPPKIAFGYLLESAFSAASPAAVDVRSREPSTKPTTSESERQSSDSDTTIPHRT